MFVLRWGHILVKSPVPKIDSTKKRQKIPDLAKKLKKKFLTQIWYHMKVHLLEIIKCQSVVKLKKPTLEMIQPNLAILAHFRPHSRILQQIPHRKKSWGNNYEKNLAMQDTTNLATFVGFGYCCLTATTIVLGGFA